MAGLQVWLDYLVNQGRLVPAPAPSPPPTGMVFKAATPGASGNDIKVTISASGANAVQITVIETHLYENLTFKPDDPGCLMTVLDGSSGDMVKVQSPVSGIGGGDVPAQGTIAAAAGPTWVIKAAPPATKTLVTLAPRGPGSDKTGSSMAVTIGAPNTSDPTAVTFSLTVTWTSNTITVTGGTGGNVTSPGTYTDLGFSVLVAAPPGGSLALPKPGTFPLLGGIPATRATATVGAST